MQEQVFDKPLIPTANIGMVGDSQRAQCLELLDKIPGGEQANEYYPGNLAIEVGGIKFVKDAP